MVNYSLIMLFRLQKYKKFESNSQHNLRLRQSLISCFDCKSTKNLRAIHNHVKQSHVRLRVVSTAKVQKIWEQFTTPYGAIVYVNELFRLQKYKKFESNSQLGNAQMRQEMSCFDCKSTKNLRAIHNTTRQWQWMLIVVSTAKVQKIWEQFTTYKRAQAPLTSLFRLQKYKKFESNSQLTARWTRTRLSCFDCKSTKNLRAIHN